jgi:hypothetical protein
MTASAKGRLDAQVRAADAVEGGIEEVAGEGSQGELLHGFAAANLSAGTTLGFH